MCSHFNIEDGGQYTTFLAYYAIISRKVIMQLKCKKKIICAVCGECAVTDQMCQKWFVKFRADFSLDDAPWLSRPVEVDRDLIESS